ncbi:MAG: type II toxin-antitoxin system RelE/ParE family toxin [Flavobacteriaceae bacterium]
MQIIWTKSAVQDNLENIDYLIKEWYYSVALKYEQKVITTEELIRKSPFLGRYDDDLGLYKILVVEQIYMFYEVRGDAIYIVRMWNNFQKPYW